MVPALLALTLLLGGGTSSTPDADALHRAIVEHHTRDLDPVPERSGYRVAWAELNGEAPLEALVLLEGPMWCGTGGCTLTVWREFPEGEFRHVSLSSLCREDVRLGPAGIYGWADLVVRVTGGGREPSWRVLRYNGNAYALNPSIEAVYEGDPDSLESLDFVAAD